MARFNFWKSYQDMILSIIEDKPRFDIPIIIFKLAILISFVQVLMYLFSEFKMISQDDAKLKSLFSISEMVSIVNVLNLKGNDNLAIIVYILSQAFMYLYFIYVTFLTMAKEYLKDFYQRNLTTITLINEFLNIYFTFYLNIFLTQYIELNCGFLFCSKKSLLESMRNQFNNSSVTNQACPVPSWLSALAIIGLILAIITALITNYYFRNYQFLETNVLKRKSTILFTCLIGVRILITFIDFNGSLSGAQEFKHVLAQIFGIVSIMDFFISIPFTDQEISRFYLVTIAYFEGIVTCCNFYLLAKVVNGQEMFYMSIIFSLVICAVLQQGQKYKYESILKGYWEIEKIIPQLDYFLEQIVLLAEKSGYNEESKIILQKVYKFHRSGCKIQTCLCHKYIVLNMKMMDEQQSSQSSNLDNKELTDREFSHLLEKDINMRLVYKFIDGVFQWMFSQRCINQDTNEFEKLSLKYISFMMKYQNNPVRAYYELKVLQHKKSSFSIYFKTVTNIIGINIQHRIESSLEDEMSEGGENGAVGGGRGISGQSKIPRAAGGKASMRNELTVLTIIDVEDLCQKFIPQFLLIIQMKFDLWTKLQNGYKSMNEFQKDAINLMRLLSNLRNSFSRETRKVIYKNPDIQNSLQFQKLSQIFFLFIANDTVKAISQEMQIIELKKRDSLAEPDQLKNVSMLKGDICIIEVSLSENFGKIVSKKDEKTASFFGFSEKQDFMKVGHINDLMPDFISRIHNQLMKNFIQGTSMRSKNGGSVIYTFVKLNDGYLFPVKIHLDFSFSTSNLDFRMNAILLKNRMQQDHILFHRSGKILGMTKNVARIIFQEFNHLPRGDTGMSKLNALLLFPNIIKKIIAGRDQILNDLTKKVKSDQQSIGDSSEHISSASKSASTMTPFIEDFLGYLRFTSNPYSSNRKFMNYLNKKAQVSSMSAKSQYRYNEIDLLDKNSLKILRQFEEQDTGQSSNRSHHDSSERLLSGRDGFAKDLDLSVFKQSSKMQTMNTCISKQIQMEYKIKFDYSLSYCMLSQKNNPQLQTTTAKKQSRYQYQNTIDAKQPNGKDEFSDIIFDLCIENLITKCSQKKQRYKSKETFVRNLCTYFKSTTSLLSISNQADTIQLLKGGISFMENTDEINQDSQQNQKQSNISTQINENLVPLLSSSIQEEFITLPKKMLQLLQINAINQGNIVIEEEELYYNEKGYDGDSGIKRNDSSYKSINSQTENSDILSEDLDYEKIYNNVINQVYNNKYSKDALDSHSVQLETLMNNYCAVKNVLPSIDPNYPVKKILQNRSLCCAFSSAFEIALTENILLLEMENRKQKSNIDIKDLSHRQELQFKHIKKEDIRQPITFRQGQDTSVLDISIEQIPSNNLVHLQNQKHSAQTVRNVNNLTSIPTENNVDISQNEQLQQLNEDINMVSHQIKNLKLERDNTLGASYLYNSPNQSQIQVEMHDFLKENKTQDQTILDITAQPILNQSNIHLQDHQLEERVNTPSQLSQIDINEQIINKQISFQNTNKDQVTLNQQYKTQVSDNQGFPNILKIESDIRVGYNIQINQMNETFFRKSNNQNNNQNDNNIQSMKNSSEKNQNEENEDSQEFIQEQAIANILNQKGMVNGKNSIQKASVHSSSRTCSSYAGSFLKEIILRAKIPKAASQYKIILIIFFVSFLSLNITNLLIIQNDMQIFANNVVILRQPRKFLRAYGKALFGYYLSLEKQLGYLLDPQNIYQKVYEDYITSGITEYNTLSEQFSISLTQLRQSQQQQTGIETLEFKIYKRREPQTLLIDYTLLFSSQQFQVIGLSQNQTTQLKIDSFLYLRQNYFAFSSEVVSAVNFLVDGTLTAVDNLITKFTIIIISAIFGIIFVAVISLPIIKLINNYEEKIMMIVTRINYDQSEMEKCKLQVCKQLINVDFIDWLNYNYFDIFSMTAQKNNDLGQSQSSKHPSQSNPANLLSGKLKSKKKVNPKELIEHQRQQSDQMLGQSSTLQLKQQDESKQIGKSFFSSKPKITNHLHMTKFNNQKQVLQKKSNNRDEGNNSTKNNNYLLQSKIINQNLTIFDRFLTLMTLTTFNCIYFLVIIIYLTQSKDQLKIPVQMNQRSINLHIIQTNMKIAVELLAFDYYIRDELWSDYTIDDLDEFYSQIYQSLVNIKTIQDQNTNIIYGSNPFPSDVVLKLKDIQEGRGCQYMVKYLCNSPNDELGLRAINANKEKFITEYPNILSPDKPPPDQLIPYLNGDAHINQFVLSFQSEDELFDVYSSSINTSISTVSLQVQNFLQQYLIIAGVVFSVIIFFTTIINWIFLYNRLQHMNLLLSIIPEEKLQEDVTMHMIRQLHRM